MTENREPRPSNTPERAQVLVVGGGVVGCSIAYHLTKHGLSDVVVLERHQLTAGTTWHAAGLVGQLRATENLTRLARYTVELYQSLEAETGLATGFRSPGAISLASTGTRWQELTRTAAMARYLGVEANEIGPAEIADLFPMCETADLVGGIWLPSDGVVGPTDVTMALAAGARNGGARIIEGVGVEDLVVDEDVSAGSGRRCLGVVTEDGQRIEAETVVLAAGLWTRTLAAKAGVRVPLMAAEHHYVVTEPIEGCRADWPVLRDPDRWAYLKPEAGGALMVGLFEPVGRPWPAAGPPPTDQAFISMEPDAEHLARWLPPTFDRVPALHEAGLRLLFDGPEAFTPDDAYILGEAPNLDGLFVSAGFNSIGIQSAGGVGMAMAHWITEGSPPFDLSDVDIRRFEPFESTEVHLRQRTVEGLGLLYANHWPNRQYETGRNVRRSALHDRLAESGACFGSVAGWERPMFFADHELGVEAAYEYSWGRENWDPAHAKEHRAVRSGVGLFDLSSFSIFFVQGAEAATVLDRLSSGPVAGAVGRSVYTQWLNEAGGIEADLTVSRRSDTEFWVIGGAATRTRDLHRLRRRIAAHHNPGGCTVTDLTSAYATIAIMGPASRALLSELIDGDLSDEGFGFGTHQDLDLASAPVVANRLSYVGELGWELYIPTEFAVHVFDAVAEAGAAHGLVHCGFHALNSLRLERGYRHWGHDIGPDDSPVQAGLSFAIGWDKPAAFIGRDAVERQRAEGVNRRLVQLSVADDEVLLHHDEPIMRNGVRVGYVTSGMWGHSVGAAVAMGWVHRAEPVSADWLADGQWHVEVGGGTYPATVQLKALLAR